MMMTRWNPFREIVEMQRTMDRMVDEVNRVVGSNATEWSAVGKWLALDVYENDDNFIVEANVPGLTPDDIEITVHEHTLTISGEVTQAELPDDTRQILNERRFGTFRRSVTLPSMVEVDKADANYHDGVLTLTLPKSEAAKPRQIAVKSGTLLENGK
ncbi:MAG: Hsp20/alpha crystallin family protein [Anaerolineae bacterium]|nr:Hsp20/alpha crystallin family protein [Anaerolineae bacterium]MDQ7037033.1 Hsp20/alpha crystallin family protein [Anaerolineae bacterium]